MLGNWSAPQNPIRSRWVANPRGKPLTDRRIEFYKKRGFYSAELRQARKELQDRKRMKRLGNFITAADGRQVYSPL